MHLGNARTALFNALMAHHHPDGVFLLRIEDTDPERSKQEFEDGLKLDLQWLGMPWNEGPEADLGNGPYHQSKRQKIYDEYYETLEKKGLAYPCFCTEQELAVSRKLQRSAGKAPRYAGTCRSLSPEEIENKISEGKKPTLRFRVEDGQLIKFDDIVRGSQRFNGIDIGDFIIRRADGTAPFMYCNAIDDALMGVTHALRGEDHLTNTPRQTLILQALELTAPTYGHISLIVGPDGSPLSKRHGSKSIKDLREEGFLPLALVNYMARLGHYYSDDHLMSLDELAEKFSTDHLGRAPAKFDEKQLHRWQHLAVHALNNGELTEWLGDELLERVPEEQRDQFLTTIHPNITFPSEAAQWVEIFFGDGPKWTDENTAIIKDAGEKFFEAALSACDQHSDDIKAITEALKTELGVKGKQLFWPLRVAMTGLTHGPEMIHVAKLLGAKKIRQSYEQALELALGK